MDVTRYLVCGGATLWSTRLRHERGPAGLVRYPQHSREVNDSVIAFRCPTLPPSSPRSPSRTPLFIIYPIPTQEAGNESDASSGVANVHGRRFARAVNFIYSLLIALKNVGVALSGRRYALQRHLVASYNKMDWLSFTNKFDSLFNARADLTAGQKFTYLLSCLSAEPRGLMQDLNINDDSYSIPRYFLESRYQNTRRLADSLISEILNLLNFAGARSRLWIDFLYPLLLMESGRNASPRTGTKMGLIHAGVSVTSYAEVISLRGQVMRRQYPHVLCDYVR
ncbi:hypothetical protein EVAR_81575_1 [Eumeta japonica]|uniref:Uncharacterized protein n=1 Tax=Eumeta variegata TaxID=151549 RepID=A0A4C1V000_EUMVA|nr:hypothetical protein EVAR_81575_1 [Eumeta japonica]